MDREDTYTENGDNDNSRFGDGRNERIKIGDHVVLYRRGARGVWTADFHYVDQNGRRQHGRSGWRRCRSGNRTRRN